MNATPSYQPPGQDPFFFQPTDPLCEPDPTEKQRRLVQRRWFELGAHPSSRRGDAPWPFASAFAVLIVMTVFLIIAIFKMSRTIDTLIIAIGSAILVVPLWVLVIKEALFRLNMESAFRVLAGVLGGTWGADRWISVADWLDRSWVANSPREVLDFPLGDFMEKRWDLQSWYQNLPMLLHVQRRSGLLSSIPPVARISLYLSADGAVPPAGFDPAPAYAELKRLGFWVRQMKGGVFASVNEVSPAALDPNRIRDALEAMKSLITGQPPRRRTPLLKGF